MVDDIRGKAANLLSAAYRGQPIAPLTQLFPGLRIADAYAIQRIQVERWVSDGATVKGHKVGLTSHVMQRQLGVSEPDYGHLLDTMFRVDGGSIALEAFSQPKVEPEIAVVLGRTLRGPGITAADAASAVRYIIPALEVIDSRIKDWRLTLADTIADNASSGGVVLGSQFSSPVGVDLGMIGCVLRHNGEVVDTGAGAAVMGSPLNSLVWLANTLGRLGVALEPDHVVLTGSLTAAHPIREGDSFSAEFSGIGAVTAKFQKEKR